MTAIDLITLDPAQSGDLALRGIRVTAHIGGFAERRLRTVLEGDLVDGAFARTVRVAQILHPSPASPAANRGWTAAVDARLAELGVF
jgi:single-strand selective monofunctional uracil DNA glycosylase